MKKHKACFTPSECCTDYCPNIQYDIVDQTWGYGIADDCGLEKIKCKDCFFMTYRCEDCMFQYYTENCPEWSEYNAT